MPDPSGHRLFTVGVGSAVSEAFVRQLAERSGGACELVSPREDMAERIVSHARRIREPRAREVRVSWPSPPLRQVPEQIETVFDGDTLHIHAWLSEPPQVLAAGWGGMGRVCCDASPAPSEALFSRLPLGDAESVAPSPLIRPSEVEQLRKIRQPTHSARLRAYLNADEMDGAAGQPQPPASFAGRPAR